MDKISFFYKIQIAGLILLIIMFLFGINGNCAEKKFYKVSKKKETIIDLRYECLQWKEKYYKECSLTLQLKALLKNSMTIEFLETQKNIREVEQKLEILKLNIEKEKKRRKR